MARTATNNRMMDGRTGVLPRVPRVARVAATLGLAAGVLALSGCVGYADSPVMNDPAGEFEGVNRGTTPLLIGTAVGFVARRYPPTVGHDRGIPYEGPIAVSVPRGMTPENYALVVERVGPHAQIAMASNADLPTYSVARANVRFTTAEIDIVFPAVVFGAGEGGEARYQGATVYMTGGAQPWKVKTHRLFPVGILDVPARNELDASAILAPSDPEELSPGLAPAVAPEPAMPDGEE